MPFRDIIEIKMGARYSREDLEQIKARIAEGLTNREIATGLGRTEAGIRNLRYRLKLEADTRETLQSLLRERKALSKKITGLDWSRAQLSSEIKSLQDKKDNISELLRIDEEALKERLKTALTELKHQKPELFHISGAEQIGKIAGYLTGAFIKWLVS